MKKINWKLIGVCFAGISALVGIGMAYTNTLSTFDTRYAHAETTKHFMEVANQQMKYNERRMDTKIIEDQLEALDNRKWTLKNRYRGVTLPPDVQRSVADIEKKMKRLNKKLDILYSLTTK
jgi:peptidoglycan hydrolase CwlO-like protein